MLRLQKLVNASDTLCTCSFGRSTLKCVDKTCNIIFRTHITSNVLSTNPSTNTTINRFVSKNSTRLKVLCVKKFHTQIMPECQAKKTDSLNNSIIQSLLNEQTGGDRNNVKVRKQYGVERLERRTTQPKKQLNEINFEDLLTEPRKHHSEKQLFHKQMACHSETLKEFPIPTSSLHNVYSIVQSQLNMDQVLVLKYKEDPKGWKCTCTVKWPEEREFTAVERMKKKAASTVSLQCLHWLKETKKIKNGLPVVFDITKITKALNNPSLITINSDMEKKLKKLLENYETNIQPTLVKANLHDIQKNEGAIVDELDFGNQVFHNLKQRNVISIPKIQPEVRNKTLYARLQTRKPVGYDLPINAYRNEIVKIVEQNQVVLIKGDTGCGKTTQVPQFIMDSFIQRGEASKCNMIVTEPRRISAITLAERIAHERGEKLGDVIGYKVKLQHKLPQTPGAILFCTPGTLLRKMQENPTLTGCSHVIIDEAHERKVDVDILLALLKRIIKKNREIKVIIMSATLNADTFTRYFDCVSMDVPGKIFPVKSHFIDDMRKFVKLKGGSENTRFPQVDYEEVANMIQWISDNKPAGAILCFLPGWNEIMQVETLLKQINRRGTRQVVLPLHSQLSYSDQQRIFEPPPTNVRKIILSTDIAETGITVRDVVYVVDSALHKELKWDKTKEINVIQNYRIAQANLLQRKGRAGRVQPGESYHFVSKREYERMRQFTEPEIQCLSLERVILDCKLCSDDKVEDFLAELPDPPDVRVLRTSVKNLIDLGALNTDESLTVLGRKISCLSLPPILGKTLLYSSVFGCLDPILTIATISAINMEIFMNAMSRKEEIRTLKRRFSVNSDHLALAWLYMQWESYLHENLELAEQFSFECGVTHYRMLTVKKQREQFLRQLAEMVGMRDQNLDANHPFNKNIQNDELIKSVILAGMNNVLKHVHFAKVRERLVRSSKEFQDESKCSTNLTPESVNYSPKEELTSNYFTYIKKTYAGDRRKLIVRESSPVSPISVFLFAQGHLFGYEHFSADLQNLNNNKNDFAFKNQILMKFNDMENVSLICDENTADILFRLRDCLWEVVRYIINNQGQLLVNQCQQLPVVEQFKDEMLTTINELLDANVKCTNTSEKLKAGNFNMIRSTNTDDKNKFTEYDGIDMETDSENENEYESDSEYEDESETDAYNENDRV
ncbi:ATP-dependent RNA helicase DHX30-like [Leptopilina heterotoma]|uniref:ATP-dependent RNA helicase DHX30-like n=1 Tax=Leptopilina heterotoma TaxID=63436 RepID=UPI001CA7DDD6|nr:ATP-dependent RNA helicase DHX30-like [Leptopilina heterotoma]XP_043476605.1 ATP-dependent RNA helicase DHX30-like [Leptopilina heterotoma]